jgi:serine protease Do
VEATRTIESSVVNINTEEVVRASSRRGVDPFSFFGIPQQPEQYTRQSLGSGVVVDPKGYILTNWHVVQGATKIRISFKGGKEYSARIIGGDELSDIAVIRIEGAGTFPAARIGDDRALKVGDWVLAIGSPFGLDQTVTAGIISTTGRIFDSPDMPQMLFNDYLQTDAAINPGNSGGPLVNMNAEVVGINSFISTRAQQNAGVGFAVPAHIFVSVYNQIIEKGTVRRGWLGVTMNNLPFTPAMAKHFGVKQGSGVLVTGLTSEAGDPSESGPAARAGIKAEDVIVEFDGKKINSVQDLRIAVANTPPGKRVSVKAIRRGEEKILNIEIAERTIDGQRAEQGNFSLDEKAVELKPEIGLTFDNVPPRLAQSMSLSGGAMVTSVKPGSLSEEAGLQGSDQGGADVIVEANSLKIADARDLLNVVRDLKSGDSVVLKFLRVQGAPNNRITTATFYTSITKP